MLKGMGISDPLQEVKAHGIMTKRDGTRGGRRKAEQRLGTDERPLQILYTGKNECSESHTP